MVGLDDLVWHTHLFPEACVSVCEYVPQNTDSNKPDRNWLCAILDRAVLGAEEASCIFASGILLFQIIGTKRDWGIFFY